MHVWYLKWKDSFCPSAASLVIRRNGNSSASTGIRLSCCWCHNWLPFTEMWERLAAGPGRLSLPPPFKGFDSKCDSQLLSVFPPVDMHLKRYAKQKNVYFSFGGMNAAHIFQIKYPRTLYYVMNFFFTQSYFLKVKLCSQWNSEEIHNWLEWDQDIAFKARFSAQCLAFVYATK